MAAAVRRLISDTVARAPWSRPARSYVLHESESITAPDAAEATNGGGAAESAAAYRIGHGAEPGQAEWSGPSRNQNRRAWNDESFDVDRVGGTTRRHEPTTGTVPSPWFLAPDHPIDRRTLDHPRGDSDQRPNDARLPRSQPMPPTATPATRPIDQPDLWQDRGLRSLRFVGQVLGTFLVLEGDGELVLLDQHAAHERVNYNRIMAQLGAERLPSQRLLVPQTLSLTAREAATAMAHGQDLARFGFELEPFGGDTFVLKAVPVLVAEGQSDPEAVVRELLDQIQDPSVQADPESLYSGMTATVACHASVRSGRSMSPDEVDALLDDMETPGPWDHCPHGRPVIVRLSESDLRKWFHRT